MSKTTNKMPQVLPPYKIETPVYVAGMTVSVQPMTAKHSYWLDDYEYYDQLGRDPLQAQKVWGISDSHERIERLKEVLEEFPKVKDRRRILFKAARRGDEDIVRYLVELGVRAHPDLQKAKEEEEGEGSDDGDNMDLPDKELVSVTPVHTAAANGRLGCLKIFFEHGVDVDGRDEMGRTPLLAAAGKNQSEVIRYLLSQGADPTIRGFQSDLSTKWYGFYAGSNSLESVAQHGDVEVLKVMLERPRIEVTPMAIQTAGMGGYEALMLMLEHGGYVVQDQDGDPSKEPSQEKIQAIIDAVPMAVEYGDLASIRLLLSYRFPDLKDGDFTHFDVPDDLRKLFTYGAYNAMILNQVDKFEFIHGLGLREHDTMSLDDVPKSQTINIQHLLDKAAGAGSIDCARLLIEKYGADPNKYRMPGGVLPLYYAACNDKPDMVRFLLDNHNVDTHMGNGRYSAGPTALWIAISLKHFEVVTLLLEHGGPVDYIDDELMNAKESLSAVLLTDMDYCRVRFKTEANARNYIESAKHNYSVPSPPYVRLTVGPQDRDWIRNLQHRRPDEELRESGYSARELNEKEDLEPSDVRHLLAPFPTIEGRQKQLDEDDDLIPAFIPALTT